VFLISNNRVVNRIHQSLQATKELLVSSLIYGERFTGKRSLVRQIYSNSFWVDGSNFDEVKSAIEKHSSVVVTNFEKITNYDILDFENINLVAIYNGKSYNRVLEDKFAFIYYMPSLSEREEDVKLFIDHFYKEAKDVLEIEEDIEIKKQELEIYNNLKSLRKSIYKTLAIKSMKKDELSLALYNFFLKNISGFNIYKKELALFEKALITAGLEKYGSQLRLAEALGINRNTLRKKINEHFGRD
jgi:DNA-binding protein Fis